MISKGKFLVINVLILAAGLFVHLHQEIKMPLNSPLSQFPSQVSEWRMISESQFAENILASLKPTDYMAREYVGSGGTQVQLYIGYHGGGKGGGEIHSPKHCLPGSGWYEAMSKPSELSVGGKTLKVVQSVYQKGDEKQLFLYWFQVRDKTVSNEYALKIAQIVNSITSRRRDASFIRITVPVHGGVDQSIAVGEKYVRDFYPAIMAYLPQ